MNRILLACLGAAVLAASPGDDGAITLESLLQEMIDRDALARWPRPEYACRQDGSTDRRTKTPADPKGWFANGDNMESLGAPTKWEVRGGRNEAVLLDVDGPGAVVRFWSGGAPPKGKVRFSVNGRPVDAPFDGYAPEPALSGPVELGVFEPKDGRIVLRAEVAGCNPASRGPKFYFGLDAVVLSAP